jgi:RNA polymerase sigma-70 factor, ECF subfamily
MENQNAVVNQEAAKALVSELRCGSDSERELFDTLFHELRRIARIKMGRERVDHTLQATALVNEAFLKVLKTGLPSECWSNPSRALRVIARAMEQILNDYADGHFAQIRGGRKKQRVALDENQARDMANDSESPLPIDSELMVPPERHEEVLTVRKMLSSLEKAAPRQAEVLRLQYYCGMTQEEIARFLDLSVETIKIDTRKAKAFLKAGYQTTFSSPINPLKGGTCL